jgi:hypothetical protein
MAVLSCEFLDRVEHNEGIRLVTQTVTLISPDGFGPPESLSLDCIARTLSIHRGFIKFSIGLSHSLISLVHKNRDNSHLKQLDSQQGKIALGKLTPNTRSNSY